MQFLRQVFATILGIFATIFLVIILAIITIVSASRTAGERVPIKDNTILKLNFSVTINEVGEENPLEGFGGSTF
ncbi:MAG: hypothetical protein RMJ89_08685, partial [Flammeovirgaceae bacterium]|nr:hypothetical protein [Flammeovirgaceae bacterium]